MAKFDHERAHMAANLVLDPPVSCDLKILMLIADQCNNSFNSTTK